MEERLLVSLGSRWYGSERSSSEFSGKTFRVDWRGLWYCRRADSESCRPIESPAAGSAGHEIFLPCRHWNKAWE